MDTPVHKQLLFAHFAGHTTPLQQHLIQDWLLLEANQEQYYEWLEEWDRLNLQYQPDADRTYEKLMRQIDVAAHPRAVSPFKSIPFLFHWSVAASILLVCLLGIGYLFSERLLYKNLETAYGEVRKETLPDGSLVTMNAHSQLRYPRFGFSQDSRDVYLTGEATFSVRHQINNQRFIVHTDRQFDITVLGTEFTVSARNQATQVVLHRGKVQIDYQEKAEAKRLTMLPGDLAKLDLAGEHMEVKHLEHPERQKAWEDHRYLFDETSLLEIARILKEDFGLDVTIKGDSLAKRTISGSFDAKTADGLLNAVSELLEINYNRQNNKVTLFD